MATATVARDIMTPNPLIMKVDDPVIDGTEVVGMVSMADVARAADETQVGKLVEAISSAPDNTARG